MTGSIRRILWTAFGALFVFVTIAATMSILVLQSEQRQQSRAAKVYEPLLESMMSMDSSISSMLAAARGYTLIGRTEFLAQYDEAIRNFEKTASAAMGLVTQPRDRELIEGMRAHFRELKDLSDEQIAEYEGGEMSAAIETMLEAARKRRSAYDFAGAFSDKERVSRAQYRDELDRLRLAQMIVLIVVSVALLSFAGFLVVRIERNLDASIARQVRRTEAMIAGMADGVMLVESDGTTGFVNPAAARILGTSAVGVSLEEQAKLFGLKKPSGEPLQPYEIPAARALSSGLGIRDATLMIENEAAGRLDVSMNAVPIIEEDGRVSGAVVSFRDVTERRRLEDQMQLQTERAQTLADAGAFFASNIDPGWVTQAIAERVAEVLGDWAAVILVEPGTSELKVASIYHRDMASLGLAWAFVYRQALILGEGLFGQTISTGYPSLVSNLDLAPDADTQATYHQAQMKLASLLVLPLRTRREIIGALVIAAHGSDRQMSDQKLPLAELLAERGAVAIENARLYTEQVDARKKVEDLSRLKDEFLSIASHELRTPVTSIKGYTQLSRTLIREGELGTSVEYLDVALEQIDRMSRLILELLDVSRIETGRLGIRKESIDWAAFVRTVRDRYQTSIRDRQLRLEIAEADLRVDGDPDRLEQVLGNLLENAVKYSPEGSDVEVIVDRKGDQIQTSVCDQGMGIPVDELGQVFERFHRGRQVSSTNYGGLGLGLYISKQIIERHGGTIWVESHPGAGAMFRFTLPIIEAGTDALPVDSPVANPV